MCRFGAQCPNGRLGLLAFRRREVIPALDRAQLIAQPARQAGPRGRVRRGISAGGGCRGDNGLVLSGTRRGHDLGKTGFLGSRRRAREPDRGSAARVGDFLADPFELLTGTGPGRKSDQTVADLGNPELAELAPDRAPRRRRLAGKPVAQQHPFARRPVRGMCAAHAASMQPRSQIGNR